MKENLKNPLLSKNSLDQKIDFRQGEVNQTFISFLQKRRKKIYLYLFIC